MLDKSYALFFNVVNIVGVITIVYFDIYMNEWNNISDFIEPDNIKLIE